MAAPSPPVPRRAPLTEAELAAATVALLGQPAYWPSLLLPPPTLALAASAPWTAWWATRLATTLEPPLAREVYAACLGAFAEPDARWGRLLCIGAAIESFYVDEGPLDPMDDWIDRLRADWPASDTDWPSAELHARLLGCGVGILLRQPGHPRLPGWAEAAGPLLRRLPPGPGRLKLATLLLQFHLWRGEFGRTAMLIESTPGLDPTHLLPDEAMVWHESVATHARFVGQPELGIASIEAALALVARHGLSHHAYALHAHGASLALAAADAPRAQGHLDAMRPVLAGRPQADQTHWWHFNTGLHLLRGETAAAVETARATLDNSGEIGGPYRSASHRLSLGQALLAHGAAAEALAHFQDTETLARGIDARLVASTAVWMQAAVALKRGGEARALPLLRTAAADLAANDDRTLSGWWLAGPTSALLTLALRHDIEPDWVRRFARRRRLPAPDPTLAAWPWALTLRGFGEFEVRLHGEPLEQAGPKAAQRPLDLLRALLAHGGAPLPVATAMDWLWPEAEPAAQRKAFDVALLRLRRLLGDDALLRLDGSRLSLAPEWAWTDVGALGAISHRIGHAGDATPAELLRWADELLTLMRGPLLAGTEADWARTARERYRQRFVVAVGQLAARLEQHDDDEAAIALYQRALDIDPLAESLARRLVRLHADRGDRAEALRVLRGLCTLLRLDAGLGPSRETRALADELGLPLG